MANLIEGNADDEMLRYEEAYNIKTYSGLTPEALRGGIVQHDSRRGVDVVFAELPSGGAVRIGERQADPASIAQTDVEAQVQDQVAQAQDGIESVVSAKGPNAMPTMDDYLAAGYTEQEVRDFEAQRMESFLQGAGAGASIQDPVQMTPEQRQQYAAQPGAETVATDPAFFEGTVSEAVKGLARGAIVNPAKFLKENLGVYDPLVFQVIDPVTGEFDPQMRIVSREEKDAIDRSIAAGEMPYAVDFEELVAAGESAGTGAEIIGGISQFMGAFAGLGKLFRLGKGIAGATTQGAAADFLGFEGDEGRLTDVLLEMGVPENQVTNFLKTDPNDPDYVGRFKNALEGGVLGIMADQIGPVFRMIKEGGNKAEISQRIEDLRKQSGQAFANFTADAVGASRAIAQGDKEKLLEVFQPSRPPQSLSAAAKDTSKMILEMNIKADKRLSDLFDAAGVSVDSPLEDIDAVLRRAVRSDIINERDAEKIIVGMKGE